MITTILLWTGAVTWVIIGSLALTLFFIGMAKLAEETCYVGCHRNAVDKTKIVSVIILKVGVSFVKTGSDIEKSVRQGRWPWKPIKTYRVTKNYSVFPVHPWKRLSKKEIRKELP